MIINLEFSEGLISDPLKTEKLYNYSKESEDFYGSLKKSKKKG